MNVSSTLKRQLRDALLDAYHDRSAIDALLQLIDRSAEAPIDAGDLRVYALNVVVKAKEGGWLLDLVREAHEDTPGNPKLRDAYAALQALSDRASTAPARSEEHRRAFDTSSVAPERIPLKIDRAQLDAAQRRFEGLPLDRIPDLAALLGGSRMPLARNPFFVGRGDQLIGVALALKTPNTTVCPTVAISGMGGIGKTQRVFDPFHPTTFTILSNLAQIHLFHGNRLQARQYFTRALDVAERHQHIPKVARQQLQRQLGQIGGRVKNVVKPKAKSKQR